MSFNLTVVQGRSFTNSQAESTRKPNYVCVREYIVCTYREGIKERKKTHKNKNKTKTKQKLQGIKSEGTKFSCIIMVLNSG